MPLNSKKLVLGLDGDWYGEIQGAAFDVLRKVIEWVLGVVIDGDKKRSSPRTDMMMIVVDRRVRGIEAEFRGYGGW